MSYTCATHRSRVPRKSFGRIKGGVTTVKDERGPGLDFSLWLYFEFVYFIIKVFECSLVPTSFFPYLLTVLHAHTHIVVRINQKWQVTSCVSVLCASAHAAQGRHKCLSFLRLNYNKKDYIIKLKRVGRPICFSDCKIRMTQFLNVIIGLL